MSWQVPFLKTFAKLWKKRRNSNVFEISWVAVTSAQPKLGFKREEIQMYLWFPETGRPARSRSCALSWRSPPPCSGFRALRFVFYTLKNENNFSLFHCDNFYLFYLVYYFKKIKILIKIFQDKRVIAFIMLNFIIWLLFLKEIMLWFKTIKINFYLFNIF